MMVISSASILFFVMQVSPDVSFLLCSFGFPGLLPLDWGPFHSSSFPRWHLPVYALYFYFRCILNHCRLSLPCHPLHFHWTVWLSYPLSFWMLWLNTIQGSRIALSALPSYRFATNYRVGILQRKVGSSMSLLEYCFCSLPYSSGAIVPGHKATLSAHRPLFLPNVMQTFWWYQQLRSTSTIRIRVRTECKGLGFVVFWGSLNIAWIKSECQCVPSSPDWRFRAMIGREATIMK